MTTVKDQEQDKADETARAEGLDPNALAAIRDLLATEAEEAPEPAPRPQAHVMPAADLQAATPPTKRQMLERETIAPQEPQAGSVPLKKARKKIKRLKAPRQPVGEGNVIARVKAAVQGYRPTPRHIVIASLFLVVFFRPWLVLGIVFLSLVVLAGVFLILGYDGFWRQIMGLARWYARRHPSRASEMHRKLDGFAMRWDAILDRFPEGTVDGLYLPDFGHLAEADAKHDAALERRFSDLRESEV